MSFEIIIFIINNCIAPLVEGYVIVAFSNILLKKRFDSKYIYFFVAIQMALVIQIISRNKDLIFQLLLGLIIVILINIYYEGKLFKKVISYFLYISTLYIGDFITMILLVTLTGKNLSVFLTSSYYFAWGVIISKTLELLILKLVSIKYLNKNVVVKNQYRYLSVSLVFFLLITFFIIAEIFYANAFLEGYIMSLTVIVVASSILFIVALIIYVFNKKIQETKNEAEQKQLLEQYQLEQKYSKELNIVLDNLRILKHDLKNHISCMWGLVETNNIEEFKVYLSNLTKELEKIDDEEKVFRVR